MHPFTYAESLSSDQATRTVAADPNAIFFAGGTTLIDLMKLEVMRPSAMVSIGHLPFSSIEVNGGAVRVGANVKNSDLAHHPQIREYFPVLSEALLSGASPQLRNMATTAGNLLQRTRCGYFRDLNCKCNKRVPGSGCDAMDGFNRQHAILGTSEQCIATHHSDMCVALAMLDTTIHTQRADGSSRAIAMADFYLLPGNTPEKETILEHGELITHVSLAAMPMARRSKYLKVRDRASYEFALASAAVAMNVKDGTVKDARIAFGGIATIPWRSHEAEEALKGKKAETASFRAAAEAALSGAKTREHNAFKVELAKRTLVFALEELMDDGKAA